MNRHLNLSVTDDVAHALAVFPNGIQQKLVNIAVEWKTNNSINPSSIRDLMSALSTLPDDTAKEHVVGLRPFHEIQAPVTPAHLHRVRETFADARAQIDQTVDDANGNSFQPGTYVMAKVEDKANRGVIIDHNSLDVDLSCPSMMVMAKISDMHPDGLLTVNAFGYMCTTTMATVVHGSNALECLNIMGTKFNLEKVVTATGLTPEKVLSTWGQMFSGMKITGQQLMVLEGRSGQLLLAFHGKEKRARPIVTYDEEEDAKFSCAGSKRKATTSGSSSGNKKSTHPGRANLLPKDRFCNHCGFRWPAGCFKISDFATHQNRCKNGATHCKDSRAAGKLATDA